MEGVGKPTPSLFLGISSDKSDGMISDVTGILLAGGKSRRMGEDKRYLHVGEQTLLERDLSVLRSVFHDVAIVLAQDSAVLDQDVPVLRDLVPDCGSLGGLYTGLKHAKTPHIFIVACDMPFVNAAVVQYFTSLKGDADIVMAKLKTGLHPMHALYGQRCLPAIEEMIRQRDLKIQKLAAHGALKVRLVNDADLAGVDPEGYSFINVNTPADLDAARMLVARKTPPLPS
jgi:molybdenum cofactor guanylyltransferase